MSARFLPVTLVWCAFFLMSLAEPPRLSGQEKNNQEESHQQRVQKR